MRKLFDFNFFMGICAGILIFSATVGGKKLYDNYQLYKHQANYYRELYQEERVKNMFSKLHQHRK